MKRAIIFLLAISLLCPDVLHGRGQDIDSLAFCNAEWQITGLGKGAQAMYAVIPMFHSTQSICVIKYPAKKFRTSLVDRSAGKATITSLVGEETGACMAINAGYFNMKSLIPTVYCRIDTVVYGRTQARETYRVNGVVGFNDEKGSKMFIAYCDTTQYDAVCKDWHSVIATGPVLMTDGKIRVPVAKGKSGFYNNRHPRTAIGSDSKGNIYLVVIDGRFEGQGDGASIYETAQISRMLGMTQAINLDGGGSSALWSRKTGIINHPSDNRTWDHKGERSVPNFIVVH